MIQKIIKVGTSAAVVIPKDFLMGSGFKVGDKVSVDLDEEAKVVTIAPTSKKIKETADWTDKFIKKYKKALDALADK